MSYKHFYVSIILRLLIIILLSVAIAYLYFVKHELILSSLILIMLIFAVINIIRYFNGLNRWIASFLLGIENDDTTLKIPARTNNKAIDDVYSGIESLNQLFRQIKLDISAQEQYFRSVIDQSVTGLFSVNHGGRIININPAATNLTGLNEYHHINSLNAIDKKLPAFILGPSNKNVGKSTIFENPSGQKLLFKISEIQTNTEKIKLVAVSDITKELDHREIDSWIKLARTLSHEIMNNITPITTLSKVISDYFISNNKILRKEDMSSTTIENTVKGLKVIEERGLGLINFVENYRKFTRLPEPHYKEVNLSSLIESNLIAASAYPEFETIKLEKIIPEDISCSTDEKLLSQVMLNLLKNAVEVLIIERTLNPKIKIRLSKNDHAVKIEISNNGPQIPPEIKEQIFIPFFTTKENGSGIGLSLSKQIILQMGGDIVLTIGKDQQTTFSIMLNCEHLPQQH
ncbi:MAG: PAS domain-containing sensor histidine kinase [Bacteroidales bacterium]|nr:PAS domain-containing sensor histidine kinase [Bacteroidales bacterium]MCF8345530.1 PAS domain-containing sensor histidine kinase [Bacteroidales bacterium]MCF8350158.1 PAS domain-containing sensor histidine kinase [Bacteroidales bacterium]